MNLGLKDLFKDDPYDENPLKVLREFLEEQKKIKEIEDIRNWRFVGYVMEINYSDATIITADTYKKVVGGIPRNSLLIMVPADFEAFPIHFTLLRVRESVPTPLSREVQQTYFELQKKSMPELDVFTQNELQWGALKTSVIGMFYPNPDNHKKIEFSGDLNNYVSAHNYELYSPNDEILDLIVNSMVPEVNRFPIGKLRLTECRLHLPDKPLPNVEVQVSTKDFMGTRTAMFGKTRLGKSNVVKLIAQSLIETTKEKKNVGQIIFDINGEYANDNSWDKSKSLASVCCDSCVVYALTPKSKTPSKSLKLDFYEVPETSHKIIAALLKEDGKDGSGYISSFLSVDIPSFEKLKELKKGEDKRSKRKILMYWAILSKAGFPADIDKLKKFTSLDPGFSKKIREEIYSSANREMPQFISSLDELIGELELFAEKDRKCKIKSTSKTKKNKENSETSEVDTENSETSEDNDSANLFDADDNALLNFLHPKGKTSSGPNILNYIRKYHDQNSGYFVNEIIKYISDGKTVILDLGNAVPEVMQYFSNYLSSAIFKRQVEIFSNNALGDNYVQLYFEEAHNLFPDNEAKNDIYSRIAKEGAKYNIGMVYSTQSPSTISNDLLAQTENFFIAHISSRNEVNELSKINVTYEDIREDILQAKTPGYIRMLTRSHRFVISVQANDFSLLTSR